MGSADLKEMEAGRMDPEGRGITQAGQILGIIACILYGLSLLTFLGFVILGAGVSVFAG